MTTCLAASRQTCMVPLHSLVSGAGSCHSHPAGTSKLAQAPAPSAATRAVRTSLACFLSGRVCSRRSSIHLPRTGLGEHNMTLLHQHAVCRSRPAPRRWAATSEIALRFRFSSRVVLHQRCRLAALANWPSARPLQEAVSKRRDSVRR